MDHTTLFGWIEVLLQKLTHTLDQYCSQEPLAIEVIGPRGESTTVILLNPYAIKRTPNDLSSHKLVHLSVLVREASICSSW